MSTSGLRWLCAVEFAARLPLLGARLTQIGPSHHRGDDGTWAQPSRGSERIDARGRGSCGCSSGWGSARGTEAVHHSFAFFQSPWTSSTSPTTIMATSIHRMAELLLGMVNLLYEENGSGV